MIDGIVFDADFEEMAEESSIQEDGYDGSVALKIIRAPMPGTILKVYIKENDRVRKGRKIVSLISMKMEN